LSFYSVFKLERILEMKLKMLVLSLLLLTGTSVSLISCSGHNPTSLSNLLTPTSTPSYTNGGVVTTLAGVYNVTGFTNGNAVSVAGSGISAATFHYPYAVAVDGAGNVYVDDYSNNAIRKISKGIVTTLATGFDDPEAIAVDKTGNVYLADTNNNQITEITTNNTRINVGGNGTSGFLDGSASNAEFSEPDGVAVDNSGNVYVADYGNNVIRKISNGIVSTIAGNGTDGYVDGPGAAAEFYDVYGVAVDNSGNIYAADYENNAIRKITPGGIVSTYDPFYEPETLALDSQGDLFVANNTEVWKFSSTGQSLLAGNSTYGFVNGTGSAAEFYDIYGIAVASNGVVYVADENNQLIRQIQ